MDARSTLEHSLEQEWRVLQNQADAYEKHALYIKLLSFIIVATAVLISRGGLVIASVLVILWFQDAIWKTFQSRISDRLLKVEHALKRVSGQSSNIDPDITPCQLNAEWMEKRLGFKGLLSEYMTQALRPTVAFPHVLLIAVILIRSAI